mmetsp:Transcript_31918/g.51110  ORF Transcript_31918/g.51110 Transcript_31918/m.51110 type:complete len:208 (+) Transcript_31918:2332-2955(+)
MRTFAANRAFDLTFATAALSNLSKVPHTFRDVVGVHVSPSNSRKYSNDSGRTSSVLGVRKLTKSKFKLPVSGTDHARMAATVARPFSIPATSAPFSVTLRNAHWVWCPQRPSSASLMYITLSRATTAKSRCSERLKEYLPVGFAGVKLARLPRLSRQASHSCGSMPCSSTSVCDGSVMLENTARTRRIREEDHSTARLISSTCPALK